MSTPAASGPTPAAPTPAPRRRQASHQHSVSTHLLTAAIAFTGALGVWSAMLPWQSLIVSSAHGWPVLVCVLLVAAVSSLARLTGLGAWLALPAGLLVGLGVPLWLADASVVPTPAGVRLLAAALAEDVDAVARYAVPIPEEGGSLAVLFTLVALVAVLLVDLAVSGAGRVTLAGLVLLVLHLVPSNIGPEASAGHFALTAGFFVALLLLVRARENLRWELLAHRSLSSDHPTVPAPSWAGAGVPTALAVGGVAIAVATLTAAHLPLPEPRGGGDGQGSGGGDEVTVANPLVDLRRDLARGEDVDLLVVETGGETPTYLRTSVLTQYDGRQWSTGERAAPADQTADGTPLPPVPGLVSWSETPVEFRATDAFRSRWLPLPEQVSAVEAEKDWRYDRLTRDFVAWEEELDTAGRSWSAVQVVPEVDASSMDRGRAGGPPGGRMWTRLPDDLPPLVEDLAAEVTASADTPFRKARALQSWFRSEFDYSLDQVESVGDDDLVAFLSPEGRVGYCEQFAASMALMARSLGIPARVAVGFLSPEQTAQGQYVFSSHDLHAWPELYFEGAGWLRFEPTPGARSPEPPSWSTDPLQGESSEAPRPSASASPSASPSRAPSASPRPSLAPGAERRVADDASTVSLQSVALALGVLVLLALASTPALVRRRRRAARLGSAEPEAWWDEVRDTVVDLGGGWPRGRSPRETALAVRDAHPDVAWTALSRIVSELEIARYAAPGHGTGHGTGPGTGESSGASDVESVRGSLLTASTRGQRAGAILWPRSLFRRR